MSDDMTPAGSSFPLNSYRCLLLHLLGKTPYRRLSQTLILVLLLISPLSFSTDNVQNFTYECPLSAGCSQQSRRLAVSRRQYAGVDKPAGPAHYQPADGAAPRSFAHLFLAASPPSRAPPHSII
jgi:hypothetical protein